MDVLGRGFSLLNDDAKKEVIDFVMQKQNPTGLFIDRANNPDMYYTLFGGMLSLVTNNKKALNQLAEYLQSENKGQKSTIDASVSILIKIMLKIPVKISTIGLIKRIFYRERNINLHYKLFITALILDAKGKIHFLKKLFLRLLFSLKKTTNLPCSIRAAAIVTKNYLGMDSEKEQVGIMSFYNPSGGFKAFKTSLNSDMLSTAVALFALNYVGYDMRRIKPDCLAFIEENFSNGAFLSGDGDNTCDLEYTFYGLLALGSLTN